MEFKADSQLQDQEQQMDATVIFRYSTSGEIDYITSEETLKKYGNDEKAVLDTVLKNTIELIKEDSCSFLDHWLAGKYSYESRTRFPERPHCCPMIFY